jgi:8-oxo-dGTP pyrophosphatase MutT (NUDIX family)
MNQLLRHIDACNTALLPGGRVAFRIGAERIGWLAPVLANALVGFPDITAGPNGVTLAESAAPEFPEIARALSARGFYRWRDEAFDIRASLDGPVLGQIDRGAVPAFGVLAQGVHLNGLVRRPDGLHIWVAKRATDKATDPGKFDHIVAGGTPAGLTPDETLTKEAAEEAAIPETLICYATRQAQIAYAMEIQGGVRRDVLHCYDLYLPEDFTPVAVDGEVESFTLWPIEKALETVRQTSNFKFNVNLALIDLFLRLGMIAGAEASGLRAALSRRIAPCP